MTEPDDEPVTNFTASENEPDVDEATAENQAVVNVISTRNRTELLDLPAQLRVMIFRHLLIYPDGIS